MPKALDPLGAGVMKTCELLEVVPVNPGLEKQYVFLRAEPLLWVLQKLFLVFIFVACNFES